MSDAQTDTPRPAGSVGRVLYSISRMLAVFGGGLLCALALLTTISVIGRNFNYPIPGDFELVAIGTGIAVFAILPYCQITRGNVIVDFFMARAPDRAKAFFDMLGNTIFTVIAMLLTWRMIHGGIDMYQYSETSMTINFPRWTTFPISILFLGFLIIVTLYSIVRSFGEMRRGKIEEEES